MQRLKMQNWLLCSYCVNRYGKIHQNEKGLLNTWKRVNGQIDDSDTSQLGLYCLYKEVNVKRQNCNVQCNIEKSNITA